MQMEFEQGIWDTIQRLNFLMQVVNCWFEFPVSIYTLPSLQQTVEKEMTKHLNGFHLP